MRITLTMMMVCSLLLWVGCDTTEEVDPVRVTPGRTLKGPALFYGTVGSYAAFSNIEPRFVSGYGLVARLPGTGSNEVPAVVRQWLINEMRRQGVGSVRTDDILPRSPEQVLDSPNTAVVEVYGYIPGGAVRGTRFDLMVRAADTQTTSLAGGYLWQTDLAVDGLNSPIRFSEPQAKARGPMYLDPQDKANRQEALGREFQREAVIVAGGVVSKTRTVELVLNQPSWRVARLISDRINERFPQQPGARFLTAEPKTNLLINLTLPRAYESRPEQFLNLVKYLYTQKTGGFVPQQTAILIEAMKEASGDDARQEEIGYALQALGPNAVPTMRAFYDDPDLGLRRRVLAVGAFLGDEQTSRPLSALAEHPDRGVRLAVANSLAALPRSMRGGQALTTLLSDEDPDVRIQAYESLSLTGHPEVERRLIADPETGDLKFVLDRVVSPHPLVYVTQERIPRLVMFEPGLTFKADKVGSLWDGHMMVKTVREPIEVPAEGGAETQTFERVYTDVLFEPLTGGDFERLKLEPSLATFAFVLAHRPTMQRPMQGLDLSYSQVVNAVVGLHEQGLIDAPLRIQPNPVVDVVRGELNAADSDERRPEGLGELDDLDLEALVPGPSSSPSP